MHIAVLTKPLSYSGLVSGGREVNSCDTLQEEGKKRAPLLPCECHNVNMSTHGDVWHSHVGLGV